MFFNKYYDNPKTLHINTVEPRAYYIPTQTKMQFDFIDARLYSDRFFTLNGQWDFQFYDSVLDVPENVFKIMLENKIKVPSIWQTEGYDFRQYVNLDYQIPFDPPYVPTENPCGVYKKRFKFDKKFEKAYLNFEGVDSCFYVWLNGNFIGFSQVSHCTSEFDISSNIIDGENEITVIVLKWCCGTYFECQDKFRESGIFRDVYILNRPEGHIKDFKIETKLNDDLSISQVNIDVCGYDKSIYYSLEDFDGNIISEGNVLNENIDFEIHNPKLWQAEKPNLYLLHLNCSDEWISTYVGIRKVETKKGVLYVNNRPILIKGVNRHDSNPIKGAAVDFEDVMLDLYRVKTLLFLNGEEIDENITRIGFRTVEFSVDNGFLLNGKKTFINGVCAHQDFGLTGLAVPDNIAKHKMKLIKEMGANGYRTSHYQQTAAYLDACDEMGLLVMNEARWFESTEESFKQLESLIKRDRNRPSVIMWSTSNEEPFHVSDVGKRLHKALAAHIRKFDYTRCITLAQDRTPEKSTVYEECDVVGINYNLAIYDKVNELCPDKALFASECCATGTTRDWNYPTNQYGRIRDKDVDTNEWFLGREKTYKFLRSRPYVFGCYQWAAVEHRGEAVWPAVCSKSGALDLFLQKKGAFYQNKSHWTTEPMAHIVPHWNFEGFEGSEIPVTIYTNCDELELFLNEKSLGKKQIEKYGHGEWDVKYEAGELKVLGYIRGQKVCEHKRTTTGEPVGLKLTLDNEFEANGKDIALFTCECVDEFGNTVPDASPFVNFSVNTPAVIIGTGSDNCDHNNVTLPCRKMYMGKIRVAVKPSKEQKTMQFTAFSEGLKSANLIINIK